MKSCAFCHLLSSFTQRKKGSSARFAIGVKSVVLYGRGGFDVMMVVKKELRVTMM